MQPSEKQIQAIRQAFVDVCGPSFAPTSFDIRAAFPALEAALSAQDGGGGVKRLPRNESGIGGWTLDPVEVMEVAHKVSRDGREVSMEAAELVMLEAEVRIRSATTVETGQKPGDRAAQGTPADR